MKKRLLFLVASALLRDGAATIQTQSASERMNVKFFSKKF